MTTTTVQPTPNQFMEKYRDHLLPILNRMRDK